MPHRRDLVESFAPHPVISRHMVTNTWLGIGLPMKVPSSCAVKVLMPVSGPSTSTFTEPIIVCVYFSSGSEAICSATHCGAPY